MTHLARTKETENRACATHFFSNSSQSRCLAWAAALAATAASVFWRSSFSSCFTCPASLRQRFISAAMRVHCSHGPAGGGGGGVAASGAAIDVPASFLVAAGFLASAASAVRGFAVGVAAGSRGDGVCGQLRRALPTTAAIAGGGVTAVFLLRRPVSSEKKRQKTTENNETSFAVIKAKI